MFPTFISFQAEDNMKKYGKSLVNAVPDEATKLLKVLCTDYRPQRVQERELNIFFLFSCLGLCVRGVV